MQSLKDNSWKIAFWNGPFSGDMFIFGEGGVRLEQEENR